MCKYCDYESEDFVSEAPLFDFEFNEKFSTPKIKIDNLSVPYFKGKYPEFHLGEELSLKADVYFCGYESKEGYKKAFTFCLLAYGEDKNEEISHKELIVKDLDFNYCPMCGRKLKED